MEDPMPEHSPADAGYSRTRRIDQVDPELAPTDGASLSLRESSWLDDLLAAHSLLLKMPAGNIVELKVVVTLRTSWLAYWAREKPDHYAINVGPLVVAVRLTA